MSHTRRNGKSLIEMLVVMVGFSAVLVMAGQMLHRLSQAERLVRDSAAVGRAEIRLARDFRRDVRAASSAMRLDNPEGAGLRLTVNGEQVDWTTTEDALRRSAGAGETARREGYRLGDVETSLQLDGDRFVILDIQPRREARRPTLAGPLQIVAAVGVDRRGEPATGTTPLPAPVEAPRPAGEQTP